MESNNQNQINTVEKPHQHGIIHIILFHTYVLFLVSIILGAIVDQLQPFNFFGNPYFEYLGLFMIITGSILVYWAQVTTKTKAEEFNKERDTNFFYRGPYKYTRNPTNFGIFAMCLGLGFVMNSIFTILFTSLVYLISRFVFIRKQDSILEERYGNVFSEYKKKVKNWL